MVDSLLCNAHTSGTDALWAGTPMLTLPADNQAARVGLSLLQSVGQPQLVVRSMRAYEDVSVELASAHTGIMHMGLGGLGSPGGPSAASCHRSNVS